MPSDRMPRVIPEVRVRRAWQWDCPQCKRINHEAEFTIWDAEGLGKHAKGKCSFCFLEVELRT